MVKNFSEKSLIRPVWTKNKEVRNARVWSDGKNQLWREQLQSWRSNVLSARPRHLAVSLWPSHCLYHLGFTHVLGLMKA